MTINFLFNNQAILLTRSVMYAHEYHHALANNNSASVSPQFRKVNLGAGSWKRNYQGFCSVLEPPENRPEGSPGRLLKAASDRFVQVVDQSLVERPLLGVSSKEWDAATEILKGKMLFKFGGIYPLALSDEEIDAGVKLLSERHLLEPWNLDNPTFTGALFWARDVAVRYSE